jgi:hypothetical protein
MQSPAIDRLWSESVRAWRTGSRSASFLDRILRAFSQFVVPVDARMRVPSGALPAMYFMQLQRRD